MVARDVLCHPASSLVYVIQQIGGLYRGHRKTRSVIPRAVPQTCLKKRVFFVHPPGRTPPLSLSCVAYATPVACRRGKGHSCRWLACIGTRVYI